MNRKLAVLAASLVVAGAMAGTVLAAGSTVPTLTGCLASKDQTLIKVKVGDQPASPCSSGQTVVHLSGGDITSVSVGSGLTGGGTNGDITIGLDASFTLPQGCAAGDIVEKTSTGWTCGVDDDTTYSAGTGLDVSSSHQFSIESGYRLPASAGTGDSVIKGSDGTWVPQRYAKASQSCTSGQFVEGVTSSGGLDCAAPSAGGLSHGWTVTGGGEIFGGTIDVLTLNLPAGSYLLFADVRFIQRDADTSSVAGCTAGNGQMVVRIEEGEYAERSGSLIGALNHAGGPGTLRCTEMSPDIDIIRSDFHAIQLSGLN